MGDKVAWIVWLKPAVTVLLMFLVMGWLGRSRMRNAPAGQENQLSYPYPALIIGLVTMIFCTALAVLCNVYANKTSSLWVTLLFLGFAAGGLWYVLAFFLERHEYTAAGLASRTALGRFRFLPWSDLASVRYRPAMKWFHLETQSGKVGRLSVALMGLPEFARALRHYAPEAAFDADTLAVLDRTEAGSPPSVWADV